MATELLSNFIIMTSFKSINFGLEVCKYHSWPKYPYSEVGSKYPFRPDQAYPGANKVFQALWSITINFMFWKQKANSESRPLLQPTSTQFMSDASILENLTAYWFRCNNYKLHENLFFNMLTSELSAPFLWSCNSNYQVCGSGHSVLWYMHVCC